MAQVFLCISVDCECDKGPGWKTRRPLRFDGVLEGIASRIHPLLAHHGAKPTYLLSPELLRDGASVDALRRLDGCELGTHLHGEMEEPGAFVPDVTREVQRDYSAALERAKMASLTDTFRSAFGRSPRSFRAGRFGVGANTVPILEDLGYAVESSVTPGVDWSDVSRGLTFSRAPSQPYHPDPANPARPGSSDLLEVPVTTVPHRAARLPLVGRFVEPRWLRPTRTRGATLIAIARRATRAAVAANPRAPVVLNVMFHNVEAVAGASPYAATDRDATAILDRLAFLLAWARREAVTSIGLGDVPAVLALHGGRGDVP